MAPNTINMTVATCTNAVIIQQCYFYKNR